MLWSSSLKLYKKVASSIVLGAGIFVLVCALLKSIFVLVDPTNGAQLAGEWGTREAFVAVFTTNLPMIFPLFKNWAKSLFHDTLRITHDSNVLQKEVQIIGSGKPRERAKHSYGTDLFYTTSSQEQMVKDIPLQSIEISGNSA